MSDMALALGWGFSLSQTPMMLSLMAFSPEPRVEVWSARYANGTFAGKVDTHALSPLYFGASVMLAMTGFVTHQLQEQGLIDHVLPYTVESMQETGLWDWFLWFGFLAEHIVVTLEVLHPGDIYCASLVVVIQFWTVAVLCCPRESRRYDMVMVTCYLYSVVLAFQAMAAPRQVPLVASTIMDMLLVMGHAFEAKVNMQLVGNCRLAFVCGAALLLLSMYHKI